MLLTGSAGADTPQATTYNFSGAYVSPGCGQEFVFAVPSGTQEVDIAATSDVAANDITIDFYDPNHNLIMHQDTATSPEAIHYVPGGALQPGNYSVQVCPFTGNPQVVSGAYHGWVLVSNTALPAAPVVSPPAPSGKAPKVSINTSSGIAFAPATVVSAHFLGAEPQMTLEKHVSSHEIAGAVDPNRIFVDWPLSSRTQTSNLSRSLDGGDSFRLLVDPACPERNRPNCITGGGGDSEEDVNLVTGTLFFADQEEVASEGLASSTDHGDSFPAARQFPLTNTSTAEDRQWLAWVDPHLASTLTHPLEAFLSWHAPGLAAYVVGVDSDGVPIPQPAPQIPNVGQSGQSNVDNTNGPGQGTIYYPYEGYVQNPGVWIATAPAGQYQNPLAWHETLVSPDQASIFVWSALDQHGNAYVVWVSNGQVHLSASPIDDKRNNPTLGGRPGTFWTPEANLTPPGIQSTVFPEVTADANGHVAVAFMGAKDCGAVGPSDNCGPATHWNVYVEETQDASQLWQGGTTAFGLAQVSHRVDHLGSVCTGGTTCTGDRTLLDMFNVGYDQSGRISVLFMDNQNSLAYPDRMQNAVAGPFTEFTKQVSGPSLSGNTVNVSIPTGGRTDPAGDATWPNTAAGTNLRSLDLLGASVSNTSTDLDATIKLADPTQSGMARDLAAFNAATPTELAKTRLQYILRLETPTEVYHLSMEYTATGLRYFGGKIDANDGVYNQPPGTPEAAIVGSRYVTDAGYDVTGTLDSDGIHLHIPLSELGLSPGDRILNVTAFATAAPAESDPAADVMADPARTVDATPPFDASIQSMTGADLAVSQTDSPDPVKGGKPETYTITVRNNGPQAASGVTLHDTLSTGSKFQSISTTQGTCTTPTKNATALSCSLGAVAVNGTVRVTLQVKAPDKHGTMTNAATVAATSPADPVPANNNSSETTTVS